MSHRSLIYQAYDIGSRQFIANLPLFGVSFNDPVNNDEYGRLTGTLPVGADATDQTIERLRHQLVKDKTWLLVIEPTTRKIIWNGILKAMPWSFQDQSLKLTFFQMNWWLHNRLTGTSRSPRTWIQDDTLDIARQIVQETNNGSFGDPAILYTYELSGKLRNYKIEARSWSSIASHLTELGKGRDGFEWDLLAEWDPDDGRPRLRLFLAHPEITYPNRISLVYRSTGQGNILSPPSEWPDSSERGATRVWATGAGSGAAQAAQADTDPLAVGSGISVDGGYDWQKLLTEKVSNYGSTRLNADLIKNAREERLALSESTAPVTVTVSADNPDILTYGKGIRARLQVTDRWLNIDLPNVRVIDVEWNDGDRDEAGAQVHLTLDLSDYELPDGLDA